jgi:hypothetical protein
MKVLVVTGALAVAALAGGAAPAPAAPVHVAVFAQTGIPLTAIVWTGRRFLYLENTTNVMYTAPPAGTPLTKLAAMPNETEETRCVVSPGRYGYPSGLYYCHAPDNSIYTITPDGSSVTKIGTLPETATSDGALAFDTGGAFGHMLVAATGRSGGVSPAGGTVYTVSPAGVATKVGSYPDAGGADEIAIAPPGFGPVAGDVLLTVDAGPTGVVLAMDAKGGTRPLAKLPDGPNPIAVITRPTGRTTSPPPGLYVTDTHTMNVFYIAAGELAPYSGAVIVGTEIKGELWIIRPKAHGYQTRLLQTDLTTTPLNLEGGTWIP